MVLQVTAPKKSTDQKEAARFTCPDEVAPLVARCDQGRLTLDVTDLPKPFQGEDVDGDHV